MGVSGLLNALLLSNYKSVAIIEQKELFTRPQILKLNKDIAKQIFSLTRACQLFRKTFSSEANDILGKFVKGETQCNRIDSKIQALLEAHSANSNPNHLSLAQELFIIENILEPTPLISICNLQKLLYTSLISQRCNIGLFQSCSIKIHNITADSIIFSYKNYALNLRYNFLCDCTGYNRYILNNYPELCKDISVLNLEVRHRYHSNIHLKIHNNHNFCEKQDINQYKSALIDRGWERDFYPFYYIFEINNGKELYLYSETPEKVQNVISWAQILIRYNKSLPVNAFSILVKDIGHSIVDDNRELIEQENLYHSNHFICSPSYLSSNLITNNHYNSSILFLGDCSIIPAPRTALGITTITNEAIILEKWLGKNTVSKDEFQNYLETKINFIKHHINTVEKDHYKRM